MRIGVGAQRGGMCVYRGREGSSLDFGVPDLLYNCIKPRHGIGWGEREPGMRAGGAISDEDTASCMDIRVGGSRAGDWAHRKISRGRFSQHAGLEGTLLAISIASWLPSLLDPVSVAIADTSHVHFFFEGPDVEYMFLRIFVMA